MSLGYAPSYRLGELSGFSPAGGYLSLDFMRAGKGPEVELAHRRDTREQLDSKTQESLLTLSVGPRFERAGKLRVACRVLFGAGHFSNRSESHDTTGIGSGYALIVTAGGAVELPAGSRSFVRLGADLQAFTAGDGGVAAVRFTAGVVF